MLFINYSRDRTLSQNFIHCFKLIYSFIFLILIYYMVLLLCITYLYVTDHPLLSYNPGYATAILFSHYELYHLISDRSVRYGSCSLDGCQYLSEFFFNRIVPNSKVLSIVRLVQRYIFPHAIYIEHILYNMLKQFIFHSSYCFYLTILQRLK